MKRINILAFAIVVALAAVACQNKERPYGDSKVRLTASLSYIPTKGTPASDSGIKDYDSDETLEIALARIDQNHDTYYPSFVDCGAPILADMKAPDAMYLRDIEFTSEPQYFLDASSAINYASWYPTTGTYSTNSDATTISFPIDGATDVMYGSVSSGSKNSPFTTVNFNHALCVYRFHVYAMLSQDEDGTEINFAEKWGALQSLSVHNMPDNCIITLPLNDGVTYNIANQGTGNTIVLSDPSNNIFYDPGTELPLGIANKRLVGKCIAAAPASGVLDISLTTSNSSASQQVSIARNFKPGCAYDVILRFSDHGIINADVSVGEWHTYSEDIPVVAGTDMYYNLSTYGTANCYTIFSGNYGYSFNGQVMGNGNGASVGVANTAISPGYVDVLWTDIPEVTLDITDDNIDNPVPTQTFQLVSHELSQGKVLFKVLGDQSDNSNKALLEKGNAVIAAYEGTDNTSKILWTWHIWLTDRVKVHGYTNGYTVQDRNLGAISNQKDGNDYSGMHGLYYQWGRPTPLNKDVGEVSFAPGTATMSDAIANPTTFYGAGNTADWITSPNDNLWGWTSDATESVKTIYDPCPYGYSVSDYRMWKNMSDFQVREQYETGGVSVSIASHTIWYPFQGYMDTDGSIKTDHPLYIWSNSILPTGTSSPYHFTYDSSQHSDIVADGHRNIAAPVRCIASRGASVVKDLSSSQTANCYMVHKDGYYKFKANIRGNGVYKLLPLEGNVDAILSGDLVGDANSPVNISPARVDVLWWQGDLSSALTGTSADPDNNMCIDMMNGGALDADGYVGFAVNNFAKGNTILAAYDASDNILWTWHIWLTDAPEDIATGRYSLMDRFLGATYAPDITAGSVSMTDDECLSTFGFYYQWGRKDPIPGPESIYGSGTYSSQWWMKNGSGWVLHDNITVSDAATVATVTANPAAFYHSSNERGTTTSGWFPASFADAYTNVALWGYAVAETGVQGQTFSKTMHDPCPPGYRTPFHYAWDGTIAGVYTTVDYRYIAADEAAGFLTLTHNEAYFDADGRGIVLNKGTFDNAWYPFAGYRNAVTGSCAGVGSAGRMFTGMPMGNYNTRYYTFSSTQTSQRQNGTEMGAAFGFSIRCQKE